MEKSLNIKMQESCAAGENDGRIPIITFSRKDLPFIFYPRVAILSDEIGIQQYKAEFTKLSTFGNDISLILLLSVASSK